MTQELQQLSTRLDQLEKQNRRLKRWTTGLTAGLALVGAVGGLLGAAKVCDVVTGERLVLHDSSGRTRVMVDAYGSDSPAFVFSSRDGKAVARMGIDEAAGDFVVNVYDKKGKVANTWRLAAEAPKTQELPKTESKADTVSMHTR